MNLAGPAPVSAARLDADAPRAAALLLAAPPGRVVVATRDDGAFACAVLGARLAGRPVLPLDPASPAREVAPLLPGAGLLLLDPEPARAWPLPAGAETRVVAPAARPSAWQRLLGRAPVVESFPGCLAALDAAPPVPPDDARVSVLLRTSGTTGRPRLVPWTEAALRAQQATLSAALSVGPEARLMNLLPLHHIDGLVMGLLLAHGVGATLVRPGHRVLEDLPGVLDMVWREAVTHLVLTPALLALLLRAGEDLRELFDNRHFRMFVSTAAPLPDPLWRRMEQATGRPVVNVYGLTETGNLLFAGPGDETRRVGTVGRPRDCEIRVVDPSGASVQAGVDGELWIRGPSVLTAYADGDCPLRDGWYPTGDLAVLDTDGLVRVTGRRKAMISVGGLKVEPGEVERALLEHPAVRDASVRGEPDPLWGERVAASVVAEGVDEAVLTAWLRERLSEYKIPRSLSLVDRVSRGETGKPVARPSDSVQDRVLAIAAAVLRAPAERLSLSTRAGDVPGWDSLGHLDLVDAIERAFGVPISGRELLRLRSLGDAVSLIEGRVDG